MLLFPTKWNKKSCETLCEIYTFKYIKMGIILNSAIIEAWNLLEIQTRQLARLNDFFLFFSGFSIYYHTSHALSHRRNSCCLKMLGKLFSACIQVLKNPARIDPARMPITKVAQNHQSFTLLYGMSHESKKYSKLSSAPHQIRKNSKNSNCFDDSSNVI